MGSQLVPSLPSVPIRTSSSASSAVSSSKVSIAFSGVSSCENMTRSDGSMNRLLSSTVLLVLLLVYGVESKNYELGLYKSLLSLTKYNKLERPVVDGKKPVTVKMGLTLNQIIDIEDRSELMHLNVWLNFEWHDYRLMWNSTENGGVADLRIPADKLWRPDVLLFNSVDPSFETIFPVNFVITSDGTVTWIPPAIVKASCKLDIRWFPFDEQKCYLKFGSWTYSGKKLDLQPNGADLSEYIENGEWSLLDTPIHRIEKPHTSFPDETFPSLYFYLYLRRRTLYFGFNLIIPGMLITLMATLGFICPPDAGEKVALEITVLLSICFYVTTVVAGIMPPTSEALPLISIYFMVCLVLVTISVLFTVFVLNLRHRGALTHRMSPWTRIVLLRWLPWLMRMERTKDPTKEEDEEDDKLKHQAALIQLRRQRFEKKNKDCKLASTDVPIFSTDSIRKKREWEKSSGDYIERCLALLQRHASSEAGITTLLVLIQSIFTELKYITDRMRREENIDDAQNEWIYAALVIDRLCLIVILALVSGSTLSIVFASPYVVA